MLSRHEPLHLKYRPQSLSQLVGQDAVARTLTNALEHSRLSHAYLFTGPRGTGKTSTARILAKSLNCQASDKPTAEPCQKCTNCLEITNSFSPAVFEIDAASNNSVEDARVLIERAPLVAVGGRFKIYIIDECHMLSKEAFNALLKTLEEPPENVVFVLATTEEHKVLPTIVSRCQRLMFRLISQEKLTAHLKQTAGSENILISDEALQFIARRSAGGLRDALSLLELSSLMSTDEKPVSINDLLTLMSSLGESSLLDLSNYILQKDGNSVLQIVKNVLAEGRQPTTIVQELCRHYLNLVKASYVVEKKNNEPIEQLIYGSSDYIQGLSKQAASYSEAELTQILTELNKLESSLRYSSQAQINLEIGLLSICHRLNIPLIAELNERLIRLERSSGLSIKTEIPIEKANKKIESAQAVAPESKKIETAQPISSENNEVDEEISEVSESSLEPETNFETEKAEIAPIAPKEEENTASVDASESSTNGNAIDIDLDLIWSKILDELQRRHIPTYSLASTHAFPLSFSEGKLTLGVMVEGFKNLLEKKIEHLNSACQTISEEPMSVLIRVANKQASPPTNKHNQEKKEKSIPEIAAKPAPQIVETPAPARTEANIVEPNRTEISRTDLVQNDSSSTKEAYKIFDGPGSRLIN